MKASTLYFSLICSAVSISLVILVSICRAYIKRRREEIATAYVNKRRLEKAAGVYINNIRQEEVAAAEGFDFKRTEMPFIGNICNN